MRTPDEIKNGLEHCTQNNCIGCSYDEDCTVTDAFVKLGCDTFDYIRQLEATISEMEKVNAKLAWENGALIAKAPKWISVKGRPPEKTGLYIVCTAKRRVYTAKYLTSHSCWQKDINTHISHWMPLPLPPKEE